MIEKIINFIKSLYNDIVNDYWENIEIKAKDFSNFDFELNENLLSNEKISKELESILKEAMQITALTYISHIKKTRNIIINKENIIVLITSKLSKRHWESLHNIGLAVDIVLFEKEKKKYLLLNNEKDRIWFSVVSSYMIFKLLKDKYTFYLYPYAFHEKDHIHISFTTKRKFSSLLTSFMIRSYWWLKKVIVSISNTTITEVLKELKKYDKNISIIKEKFKMIYKEEKEAKKKIKENKENFIFVFTILFLFIAFIGNKISRKNTNREVKKIK